MTLSREPCAICGAFYEAGTGRYLSTDESVHVCANVDCETQLLKLALLRDEARDDEYKEFRMVVLRRESNA